MQCLYFRQVKEYETSKERIIQMFEVILPCLEECVRKQTGPFPFRCIVPRCGWSARLQGGCGRNAASVVVFHERCQPGCKVSAGCSVVCLLDVIMV